MSWRNRKNKKINNKQQDIIDESQSVSISSDVSKLSEDKQFKALVDSAPTLTSAVASADGNTVTLSFELDPSPILPALDPKFFDVKFDGISVPIIKVKRDYTNFKTSCRVATTASLTATYNNGTLGVGATLTGAQQVLIIDGVTLALNDRVLVKNYTGSTNGPRNGIYRLSTVGVASTTAWVMTRVTDADSNTELKSMTVYVTSGTAANIGAWELTTTGTITVGTTSLVFSKINSDAGNNYIVYLSSPVKPNMDVTVDYYPNSSDYVTNNSGTPDALLAFADEPVDTSNLQYPYGYFDPISWASNDYLGTVPNGILFERRVGFLTPPVTYDTGAPFGDAILHQDSLNTVNGLFVHYFGCYTTNNDAETPANLLGGTYFVQDMFESTVREASTLGGAEDPNTYETIGDGYNYYLVHYLNKVSGVYPTVKSIEFGLTATNSKNYVIEVKKTIASSWTPIIYMYASSGTLEYFRYVFSTALSLYAIRVRYRGDYYYQSNSALATVSARDTLSGTEAIRISHFSDFRDSQEYAVANFPATELLDPQDEGWIAFIDGTTFYDWDIINASRVWDEFSVVDETTTGNKIFTFKERLIVVVGNKIYTLDSSTGTATLVYNASSTVVNAIAIHNSKLYVGLENGNILESSTGLTFTSPVILTGLPAVKSLQSFGNKLWIGTGLDSDGIGYLYNYNGVTLARRSFGEYQVLSLGKTSNYLFVGLGSSLSGSKKGLIYYTSNGVTFTLTLNTLQDRVDVIRYNTGTSELWAGTSDGSIYVFTFKTNGEPDAISRPKQVGAPLGFKFLDFVDSPDSEFFWIVTTNLDGNVLAYNVDYEIYYDTFRPTGISINDVAYLGSEVYGIGSDGKVYKVDISLFATDEKSVYVQVRDLAGNVNTTSITDTVIYGLPSTTAVTSEVFSGKIYQVKIPTTYLYQPTTTPDELTYTAVRKWTSDDEIIVYKTTTSGGTKTLISSGFTNNNDGTITFASAQLETDEIFITINSPSDGLLTLKNTYASPSATSSLYAPSKQTRQTGTYESEPFYAPSLNRWDELSAQMHFATTAAPTSGDEYGLQIDIYVRSANTRADCIAQDWGTPYSYSTINTTSLAGLINKTYSIQAFQGKWLQFKVLMSTASQNVSPKLNFVTVSYFSANDTYFFTKRFDTATEYITAPYPEIRRGLLTYNGAANGGQIQFKYLTSETLSDSFDISKYVDITPNSIFELENPSRYIRFAILLNSAGDVALPETAAIVDEFAVQIETADKDLYWMNPDIPDV